MRPRRRMKQRPSPSLKRKQILIYAAIAIALATLIGVGLFLYFNLGFSFDSFAKKEGAGYTSSGTGEWSDANRWEKSASWIGDTPGDNVNVKYVDVYGYITKIGSLQLGGKTILTGFDTLRITQDLYVSQGASIVIESEGLLIVENNYNTDGGADTKNDAKVVVMGNLNASGGADIVNNSSFYLFGDPSSSGGATFNGEKTEPSNAQFLSEQDLISDNSDLYGFTTGSTTLPISLVYFKAKAEGKKTVLKWQTISETNNDFFTIERSKDAKSFKVIDSIQGAGNSSIRLDYQYVDEQPLAGTSYYRIKQTDFDGQFEYFDIIPVHHQNMGMGKRALDIVSIGPNPFYQSFTITCDLVEGGEVSIQLLDLNGSVMAQEKRQVYAGINKIEFQDNVGLQPGTYFLTVKHPKYQSKTTKMIKR